MRICDLSMPTADFMGKPGAGNPPAGFDEGGALSPLLYWLEKKSTTEGADGHGRKAKENRIPAGAPVGSYTRIPKVQPIFSSEVAMLP